MPYESNACATQHAKGLQGEKDSVILFCQVATCAQRQQLDRVQDTSRMPLCFLVVSRPTSWLHNRSMHLRRSCTARNAGLCHGCAQVHSTFRLVHTATGSHVEPRSFLTHVSSQQLPFLEDPKFGASETDRHM